MMASSRTLLTLAFVCLAGCLLALLALASGRATVIDRHLVLDTHNPTIVEAVTIFDSKTPEWMRVDFIHSYAYADNGNDYSKLTSFWGTDDTISACDRTNLNGRWTVARAYNRQTDTFLKVADGAFDVGNCIPKGVEGINREWHQTGTAPNDNDGRGPDWDRVNWSYISYH